MHDADKTATLKDEILAMLAKQRADLKAKEPDVMHGMDEQYRAFEDAIENYPIDNRRRYESFRDTILADSGRPKPPRRDHTGADMPGVHADPVRFTVEMRRRDYPQPFDLKGEATVMLSVKGRFDEMERLRREGRKAGPTPGSKRRFEAEE